MLDSTSEWMAYEGDAVLRAVEDTEEALAVMRGEGTDSTDDSDDQENWSDEEDTSYDDSDEDDEEEDDDGEE